MQGDNWYSATVNVSGSVIAEHNPPPAFWQVTEEETRSLGLSEGSCCGCRGPDFQLTCGWMQLLPGDLLWMGGKEWWRSGPEGAGERRGS